MHENYVNSLQADIDKLKATLSTTTDPDKKSWCEDYIKALEEEKQENFMLTKAKSNLVSTLILHQKRNQKSHEKILRKPIVMQHS